jgi:ribosomal protein L11 methyltransferase
MATRVSKRYGAGVAHTDIPVLVRVRVGPDPAEAEAAADRLWAEGATAVEIRSDPEGVTLLAGYPTPDAARVVAARLGPDLRATAEPVPDSSWQDAWRDWFEPVEVGHRLVVTPAWRPVAVGSGRLRLDIDPAGCFGSGSHPSTRMILAWLDRHPPAGAVVTDVGTGSGILAVAAARLGAAHVTAVDLDPAAVEVTRANAERNGVSGLVAASTIPVEELEPESADLVLVNVTAGTHAAVGPAAGRLVRPRGVLVVAGLLPGQWQHVSDAYASLSQVAELDLDGWAGAVLRRP